ncbi:MAG: hypothetical protein DWQ37_09890 [Planctomycetota bacterium]|nr:MAG: hypothetical protein DWQ37_09890 [Planctomycetota bacterium]
MSASANQIQSAVVSSAEWMARRKSCSLGSGRKRHVMPGTFWFAKYSMTFTTSDPQEGSGEHTPHTAHLLSTAPLVVWGSPHLCGNAILGDQLVIVAVVEIEQCLSFSHINSKLFQPKRVWISWNHKHTTVNLCSSWLAVYPRDPGANEAKIVVYYFDDDEQFAIYRKRSNRDHRSAEGQPQKPEHHGSACHNDQCDN